jgi:hypothetical protein
MTGHLGLSFISNIMALLPKRMLSIAKYTRYWMVRTGGIRESDLGYIPGLFSPSEAGAVMRMWFENEVGSDERKAIRNTVTLLSDIFDAPFVVKNLHNSFRLDGIHWVFPEARFIHVCRDPLLAAQSILLVRRSKLGNEKEWWSCRPPGYQAVLGQSALYQVLWQVKATEDAVTGFLQKCAPMYLEVAYEELCHDAEAVLVRIADRLDLEYERDSEIYELSVREEQQLPEFEWNQLLEHYSSLYGRVHDLAPRNSV